MARARNIKPGFFKNEELVELPFSTRLLFIGLWMMADREGRLEDRPKKIKMDIFPADDVDVNAALNELHAKKFIVRYSNEDGVFLEIFKFKDHQNPHYSEKPSVIKPPTFPELPPNDDAKNPELVGATPSVNVLNPESLLLNPESLEKNSPERKKPRSTPLAIGEGDLVATLPSIKGEVEVRRSFVKELIDVYPGVMVAQEIDRARLWLLANPTRCKTNVRKFLTGWVSRQQERA